MPPDPAPPSTAAAPTRRQRIAGVLLILGGLASAVALYLPWTYASWPLDPGCPDCQPETYSAWQRLVEFFPRVYGFTILGVAISLVLPLVLAFLGMWLLRQRASVPMRWKVAAIGGSIALVLMNLALIQLVHLRYFDAGATVRTQIGEPLALGAPIVLVIASFLLPERRQARQLS
jgi:hypothetical protein